MKRSDSRRAVSIYRSLLGSLLVVVALLSGTILAMSIFQARRTAQALSRTAIVQSMREVEARLQLIFRPAEETLLLMRDYGREGRLRFADAEEFVAVMAPVIRRQRKVTSLLLADATGRERMLLDAGDRWITRESRPAEWDGIVVRTERANPEAPPRTEKRKESYDCRDRPWFLQAVVEGVRWTAPYRFATSGEAGITVSIRYADPDGLESVIGLDVKLADISRFTMGLRPTPHGRAFVLADDGSVLGLPGDPRFDDPHARADALLRRPIDLGVPVVSDAAAAFRARGGDSEEPFRFDSEGEAWWAGLRTFPLGPRRELALAVVIPEDDLFGDARTQRVWILLATVAVLLFAAWYAMRLAGRYSTPIAALVQQSARIRGGDFEGGIPIESNLREVRALADAQDEMRAGLRTLFKLERDLQIAREIQEKTLPEKLPRLEGLQIAAWSAPADETGGDTYDVVGFRNVLRGGTPTRTIATDEADAAWLLLADATGHGIGPALSVTQLRSMLRMAARQGEQLERGIHAMNEQLAADLSDDRFITAWFGALDASTRVLTTFSAGQGPVLRYRAAQDEFAEPGPDAPPLGVVEDIPIRVPPATRLQPGDLYFVFSDGFSEAMGAEREMFGVERLKEIVRRERRRTPEEILAAIRRAVDEFTGGAPLDDDRTALGIKCI